jgi:hypothetical protein
MVKYEQHQPVYSFINIFGSNTPISYPRFTCRCSHIIGCIHKVVGRKLLVMDSIRNYFEHKYKDKQV